MRLRGRAVIRALKQPRSAFRYVFQNDLLVAIVEEAVERRLGGVFGEGLNGLTQAAIAALVDVDLVTRSVVEEEPVS